MILFLLALLTIKHFVFDFLYQPPYQWQNKGTYGHYGGLIHSGQHVLASYLILVWYVPNWLAFYLIAFEFIVHYHMDWFKMNLNKRKGWRPETHNQFWVLTGFDQFVHSMTYIGMAWGVASFYA